MNCPVCKQPNPAASLFCLHCGAALPSPGPWDHLPKVCPACRKPVLPNSSFCTFCGVRLIEQPPPTQPARKAEPDIPASPEAIGRELEDIEFALQRVEADLPGLKVSGKDRDSIRGKLREHRDRLERALFQHHASLDRSEAARLIGEFLHRRPDSVEGYIALGEVYMLSGEPARALEEFTIGAALAPTRPEPHVRLAEAHEARAEKLQALYEYRTAFALGVPKGEEAETRARMEPLERELLPRGDGAQPAPEETPARLAFTCSLLESLAGDNQVAWRLIQSYRQRLPPPGGAVSPTAPRPVAAAAAGGAASVPAPVRPRAAEPPGPPSPPREPFDWGAFWSAAFSERTLTAVLTFGVLLVAVSSMALLVSLWSQFHWLARQGFLVLQLAVFLGVGYSVKERLKLHLSGLALISIGALWVPLNIGALVFEFVEAPAQRTMPGIAVPLDLPAYGWLIIAAATTPAWAALTLRFRGHVLMHGTVAALGATVTLALVTVGVRWPWGLASETVAAVPLMAAGRRLERTTLASNARPLFWTAQAVWAGVVAILLPLWLLGEIESYPLALAGAAGLALFALANRIFPLLAYRYVIAGLPALTVLFALAEGTALPPRYFDALLIGMAAIHVVLGRRDEKSYTAGVLHTPPWSAAQPAYAAGYLCAAAAVAWPSVEPWSRAGTLFVAAGIAVASARWSRQTFWTAIAAMLIVPAALISVGELGAPAKAWGAVPAVLGAIYVLAGWLLRRQRLEEHERVMLSIGTALAAGAPVYQAAIHGTGWPLAGMLYGDVALTVAAIRLFKAQRLLYVALPLVAASLAVTLDLRGVDPVRWAIPWAGLALLYFAGSIAFRKSGGLALPLGLGAYLLSVMALAWSAFDASGLSARWAIPMIGGTYGVSAVLFHRGSLPAIAALAERALPRPARPLMATGFGVAAGALAPPWVALLLRWQGIEGAAHAYNPLGWAFVACLAALFVLRRHDRLYVAASLALGGALGIAALAVAWAYLNEAVSTGVLYGTAALSALYWPILRNRAAIYLSALLLPAAIALTLDMAGIQAWFWHTPAILLAIGYLGLATLPRGRSRAAAPLYHVGFGLSAVAVFMAMVLYAPAPLIQDGPVRLTLGTQRLLFSMTPLAGAIVYAAAAHRLRSVLFAYAAVGALSAGLAMVWGIAHASTGASAVALALVAAAYLLAGPAIRAARSPGGQAEEPVRTGAAPRDGVFSSPLTIIGFGLAALSLVLPIPWSHLDSQGSIGGYSDTLFWQREAAYLINTGTLAALAGLRHKPAYAAGAAALFLLPASAFIYWRFGETPAIMALPSNALAIGWAGLAAGYVTLGAALERKAEAYSRPLPILAYLLLAIAAVAAWGNAQGESIALGVAVLVSGASAALIHRGLLGSFVSLAAMIPPGAGEARRRVVVAHLSLAAIVIPLWGIAMLALFTTARPAQGLLLAALAPAYLLAGAWMDRRGRRSYGLPMTITGCALTLAAALLTAREETWRLAVLIVVALTYAAAWRAYRSQGWLYPLLGSAHLALAAGLAYPGFEPSLAVAGLLFLPVALLMGACLALAVRGVDRARCPARAMPFAVFGALDAGASLVLSAFEPWAALVASLVFAVAAAGTAQVLRSRISSYASIVMASRAAMSASQMLGLDWAGIAIVWAAKGFILWWVGQAMQALARRKDETIITTWCMPFRNSGVILSSVAVAVSCIRYALHVAAPDSFPGVTAQELTAVLAILGLLLLGMAMVGRRPWLGYAAVAMLLASWAVQMLDMRIPYPQAYALPAGLYLLGIAYFERRRDRGPLPLLIEGAGILLLTVSAFWQSVTDAPSWVFTALLALESVLLVAWAALNQTRLPFVAGLAAFFVDILYHGIAVISTFPGAWAAFTVGLLLVGTVTAIEWRRKQLVQMGRNLNSRLVQWRW